MKLIKNGSVTSPKGFKANGLAAGIKRSGKKDLSLIVSDVACPTAAVYTKNSVKAAPLLVTQEHLKGKLSQAVIANSGNANCFTGKPGLKVAKDTTQVIAKLLNIDPRLVLVASTGIIGKQLPYKCISDHAENLVKGLSDKKGHDAALGILTTDLCHKEKAIEITLSGKKCVIGGCCKGSGMIQPDMATMLAFLTTDVAITSEMLNESLAYATDHSFNCITVDGCMSTNDMVSVMANGFAGNPLIKSKGKDYETFTKALTHVCCEMAKQIVLDGEGATKFITIQVQGAQNYEQAKRAALMVANSNLVKTAAYGSNPNWGRVAAAIGALGLPVTEDNLTIKFSSFAKKNITITVNMHLGKHEATVYTCDLSPEYVHINGKYS